MRRIRRPSGERKPTAIEAVNFLDLWTTHCVFVQNHPPPLQSPTVRALYEEYMRRVKQIIERAGMGWTWKQQSRMVRNTLRLGEWIFLSWPRMSDDELLVYFATHGEETVRAREIVNETHSGKNHRQVDSDVRRDSLRAYDLAIAGKKPSVIAQRLYRRCDKNTVEIIRQRLIQVKKLLMHFRVKNPR